MVFFVCDGCSETLKKNQVDAHAARCRNCASVCCVDCNVSFFGDDYRSHTSCITESERYEGKFAKKQQAKRNPQQEWMDIVQTCASETSSSSCIQVPMHLKGYFRTMANLDNIPRKEKQFRNFTANSLGLRNGANNAKIVGEIWNVLKTERDRRMAEKQQQQEQQQQQKGNDDKNGEKSKNNKKATKKDTKDDTSDDSDSENEEKNDQRNKNETDSSSSGNNNTSNTNGTTTAPTTTITIDPKKVKKALKRALKKAPNRSMKIKELRKVLGTQLGVSEKKEKKHLKNLLSKKVPSSIFKKDKIKVDGKTITLVSE